MRFVKWYIIAATLDLSSTFIGIYFFDMLDKEVNPWLRYLFSLALKNNLYITFILGNEVLAFTVIYILLYSVGMFIKQIDYVWIFLAGIRLYAFINNARKIFINLKVLIGFPNLYIPLILLIGYILYKISEKIREFEESIYS